MADLDLVKILRQGSGVWNSWREKQPAYQQFNLHYADLYRANLDYTNLSNIDMDHANLSDADMHRAFLSGTNLCEANLSGADLREANLYCANLRGADLRGTNLSGADLHGADLRETNLSGADLREANLSSVGLNDADMRGVTTFNTVFADIDLRKVKGFAEIRHIGQSHVELHTIQFPQDGSALHFLRGCGVPDEWIDDYRVRMINPIHYHSCFISYAHQDDTLARRLHADLQDQGVRCWFAPEDMKIGDKVRTRIDEAIHIHEKLLLLLSEHALASNWVEDEVETAMEKEKNQHSEILFPIRLDNAVMETNQAWAAKLRRKCHIGDFTNWTDPHKYEQAFDRLLRDLKKANE